jgi:hypothetical protein
VQIFTTEQRNTPREKAKMNAKPKIRISGLYTALIFHGNRYKCDEVSVMNMHGMSTHSSPILTEILNKYSKSLLNLKKCSAPSFAGLSKLPK